MSYDPCDFLADVTSALDADGPESVSRQGDLALDEIERLQGIETAARLLVVDGVCQMTNLQALVDALARPKMEPRGDDDDEEDDEDEGAPSIGDRDACTNCGQEVEWNGDDWHDRGGSTHCGTAFQKPGAMVPHTVNEEEDA